MRTLSAGGSPKWFGNRRIAQGRGSFSDSQKHSAGLLLPPEYVEPLRADISQSPQSGREIRARPIDVERETPLVFVDDYEGIAADTNPHLLVHIPASRTTSTASHFGTSAVAVPAIQTFVEIAIPQYNAVTPIDNVVSQRFRRPHKHMIHGPSITDEFQTITEYELDHEDEAWLAGMNAGCKQPILDEVGSAYLPLEYVITVPTNRVTVHYITLCLCTTCPTATSCAL